MGQALYALPSQAPPCGHGRTPEIRAFLTHLAVERQVAASTSNVLQALIFLSHHLLIQPFLELEEIEHARKSRQVPAVFARQEIPKALAHLVGTLHLRQKLNMRSRAPWRWCKLPNITNKNCVAPHRHTILD